MIKRLRRVLFVALVISGLTFYFSCTQPGDILTPVTRTDVYLKAQLLPTNPEGMIYELWLTDGTENISLGKFGYHQTLLTYHDTSGAERPDSNHFVLDDDILNYTRIFITIEVNPDPEPESPGPIMLIDDVTLPSNNAIELRFPLSDSLWNITAEFCMETPSDNERNLNDGYGIWFSDYYLKRGAVQDTNELISFTIFTKEDFSITEDTDTITSYLDSIDSIRVKDTSRVFGLTEKSYSIVRWDSFLAFDSTWPYTVDSALSLTFDIAEVDSFDYDDFIQFDFGFIDYSDYGWIYKGWVVSPEVPVAAVGKITPPAYRTASNPTDSLIPGIDGGLLTTGTFTDIAVPDDIDQYSMGPRVPPFAGEDFLVNLPGGLTVPPWGGLVPNATGNSGTVFITLEPDNFVTDTTNFPLFVLIGRLPTSHSSVVRDTQRFEMKPYVQTNEGSARGFPLITVKIDRF